MTHNEPNPLQPNEDIEESSPKSLIWLGAFFLLLVIFGVPAVLLPSAMQNVPVRSETKAITTYQQAIDLVQGNFTKHERQEGLDQSQRRLMPLPQNSMEWIQLINPNGRKAPGGGFAILLQADAKTGAIGLTGSNEEVKITLPAYRTLKEQTTTISLGRMTRNNTDEKNTDEQ